MQEKYLLINNNKTLAMIGDTEVRLFVRYSE